MLIPLKYPLIKGYIGKLIPDLFINRQQSHHQNKVKNNKKREQKKDNKQILKNKHKYRGSSLKKIQVY